MAIFFFVETEKKALLLGDYEIEIIDSIENRFVDKKDIINLINVKFGLLKGKKLKDVNRDSIEKFVETHVCIRNAEVYNNANGVVTIKLIQRKPLFRVMAKKKFYVDEDRKVMPLSSKFTSRVCVVTGKVNKKLAREVLFDFCKFINCDTFWSSFIEQVHISQQNEVILIPKMGAFSILLGGLGDYQEKMLKLKAFLDKGKENRVWGRYKKINLKYENQVVCVK